MGSKWGLTGTGIIINLILWSLGSTDLLLLDLNELQSKVCLF